MLSRINCRLEPRGKGLVEEDVKRNTARLGGPNWSHKTSPKEKTDSDRRFVSSLRRFESRVLPRAFPKKDDDRRARKRKPAERDGRRMFPDPVKISPAARVSWRPLLETTPRLRAAVCTARSGGHVTDGIGKNDRARRCGTSTRRPRSDAAAERRAPLEQSPIDHVRSHFRFLCSA
ncbi:hypothetical protein MTO96_000121 [Rhipicephalus appendiculatus]